MIIEDIESNEKAIVSAAIAGIPGCRLLDFPWDKKVDQ
jgi:hypothetical protein